MGHRLLGLLLAGVVAGCGGEDSSSSAPDGTGTTAPSAAEPPPERDADEQEIADVAQRYLDALSSQDYEGACATRTEKEQRELARLAGSCPKAFAVIAREKPGLTELFEQARIGDVRVSGRTATAEIVQPGQSEAAETLAAVREGGRWLLTDG